MRLRAWKDDNAKPLASERGALCTREDALSSGRGGKHDHTLVEESPQRARHSSARTSQRVSSFDLPECFCNVKARLAVGMGLDPSQKVLVLSEKGWDDSMYASLARTGGHPIILNKGMRTRPSHGLRPGGVGRGGEAAVAGGDEQRLAKFITFPIPGP
jgi:hypothetical protein